MSTFPIICRYRSSSGWTATAVSPSMVSGRVGAAFIHGEPFTAPVTGGAESLQLTDDRSPRLLFPFPDPLDEFLPAQGMAIQASFQELFLHDVLCGNACVVRPWHPEGIVSPHPLEPDQDILQGIVQGVSDMEGACYIGRRDDNGIRVPVCMFI